MRSVKRPLTAAALEDAGAQPLREDARLRQHDGRAREKREWPRPKTASRGSRCPARVSHAHQMAASSDRDFQLDSFDRPEEQPERPAGEKTEADYDTEDFTQYVNWCAHKPPLQHSWSRNSDSSL